MQGEGWWVIMDHHGLTDTYSIAAQYATMVVGPRGFMHASFHGEGPVETEMANL